jgi:hypothetical protein
LNAAAAAYPPTFGATSDDVAESGRIHQSGRWLGCGGWEDPPAELAIRSSRPRFFLIGR